MKISWFGLMRLQLKKNYFHQNSCASVFFFQLKHIWATTWQNQQNECVPSEVSDQPGHPPSLIRVFAVRMKKPWALSYPLSAQQRLWSDWTDAQADLSLHWAHSHFVGFVMSRLIYKFVVPFTHMWFRHTSVFIWFTRSCITPNIFINKWLNRYFFL